MVGSLKSVTDRAPYAMDIIGEVADKYPIRSLDSLSTRIKNNIRLRLAGLWSSVITVLETIVSIVATIFSAMTYLFTGFNKNALKYMKAFYNKTIQCAVMLLVPSLVMGMIDPLSGIKLLQGTAKLSDKIQVKMG